MVSFLSDFGLEDTYVAQVKARILSEFPAATIVDITHEVRPYSIISGAWLLYTVYQAFPQGTIHLAVVDPGVGTSRRVLVVEKDEHIFVGPDNGIFSFLYPADKIIGISWQPSGPVSATFHGRDIFAPLVIRLLHGDRDSDLGSHVTDPIVLDTVSPQVVHIDRYGNIITNIRPIDLMGRALAMQGRIFGRLASTFEELPEVDPGLITGSAGTIEIACRRGDASGILGAYIGMSLGIV